jgi:hypothetical protein
MLGDFTRDDAARWLESNWPSTLVRDRYGGVYSGGQWIAWPLLPADVPVATSGDDVPCLHFWRDAALGDTPVGKGSTPESALKALEALVRRRAAGLVT